MMGGEHERHEVGGSEMNSQEWLRRMAVPQWAISLLSLGQYSPFLVT